MYRPISYQKAQHGTSQGTMKEKKSQTVHRDYRENRLVEIIDHGEFRSLMFSGKFLQSRMSLGSPHRLILPYTRYMMLSLLHMPSPGKVLLIGLGAGSLVRFLNHHFPLCHIDAVDHSAHVIDLARGYFRLPDSPYVRIWCMDGDEYLQHGQNESDYDLILVDAFDEHGMSQSVYSAGFFRRCRQHLSPRGILCVNLWSGKEEHLTRISGDLATLFPGNIQCPVPDRGNIIHYSFPQEIPWKKMSRSGEEFALLFDWYGLDFKTMLQQLLRHNLSLLQRLLLRIQSG